MVGHSSWKCPNSLHLKHLLLSLLIGLPGILEHLVLGLLSNLPKGLLGLNDPLLPDLPHLSLMLLLKPPKHPFCPLHPLSKFPLNFLLGWVKKGLKGFFTVQKPSLIYVRGPSTVHKQSPFMVMWGIMQRLVAYTMFFVTQSSAALQGDG